MRTPDLDFAAARRELRSFSTMATPDHPLTAWQAEALRLETRETTVTAPRQSGKSWSLATLAVWWAFRRPNQFILIVSSNEEGAKRLLAEVRAIASGSELLRGSVVDEQTGKLELSNASKVVSVTASERAIRGWSTDLLLIDEASIVADELIFAALPTTAARADARIVLASSATTASGYFYDAVMRGRAGAEHTRAFAWKLSDASWIAPSVIEAARQSMTEARFAAEYLGEFSSTADAMFPREVIDSATAAIRVAGFDGLAQVPGQLIGGADWGFTVDRSALCGIGRLKLPTGLLVVAVAHHWRSGHPLVGPRSVVEELTERAGAFKLIVGELNGLGGPLVQQLERQVRDRWSGRARMPLVTGVTTTGDLKAAAYSSLRLAFEQQRLVIPEGIEALRRELLLLRVQLLPAGGERIEAAGGGHDDLADALALSTIPYHDGKRGWRTRLQDILQLEQLDTSEDWTAERPSVRTGAGLAVPRELELMEMRVPGRRWVPLGARDEGPNLRAKGFVLEGDGRIRLMTEAEKADHEGRNAEEERSPGRRRAPLDPYPDPERRLWR